MRGVFILGIATALVSSASGVLAGTEDRAPSVERGDAVDFSELLPPARQGEPRAQCSLGFIFFRQGHYAEATKWWRLSATQGWAPAQYTLGLAYLSGVGVPKDAVMAYAWLSRALAGGAGLNADERDRAARLRRSLERILDPIEVARGRQMARDWTPTWEWRPTPAARPPESIPAVTVIAFRPGHPIYVDARVNGRTPARLVLDTGADSTVIAPDVLNAAGASVTGQTTLLGVTGQATVGIHDVAALEIGNVKVGPLKVLAHHAANPAADGLLGRDFLDRFTVTIDSAGGRVTLTPRPVDGLPQGESATLRP
jgi:Aspartyl protease